MSHPSPVPMAFLLLPEDNLVLCFLFLSPALCVGMFTGTVKCACLGGLDHLLGQLGDREWTKSRI